MSSVASSQTTRLLDLKEGLESTIKLGEHTLIVRGPNVVDQIGDSTLVIHPMREERKGKQQQKTIGKKRKNASSSSSSSSGGGGGGGHKKEVSELKHALDGLASQIAAVTSKEKAVKKEKKEIAILAKQAAKAAKQLNKETKKTTNKKKSDAPTKKRAKVSPAHSQFLLVPASATLL